MYSVKVLALAAHGSWQTNGTSDFLTVQQLFLKCFKTFYIPIVYLALWRT